MMDMYKIAIFLAFGIIVSSSVFSAANPVAQTEDEVDEAVNRNKTQKPARTAQPDSLDDAENDGDADKDKARNCALQAFQIIISENKKVLSAECQEIIKSLTRKHANKNDRNLEESEADLRKELKELTQKENQFNAMKEELSQEHSLVPENRVSQTENLKEITNSKKDDAALLEMEAEKKETHTDASNGEEYTGQFTSEDGQKTKKNTAASFPARFSVMRETKLPDATPAEGFQNGKYVIRDGEIGILGQDGGQHDINEDFLVIPLQYLRQEYLTGKTPSRHTAITRSDEVDQRRGSQIDNETKAAKWVLRSILDRLPDAEDDDRSGKDDPFNLSTMEHQQRGEGFKSQMEGEDSFDVKGSPDIDAGESIRDKDGLYEEPYSSPESHEDGLEILAQVEEDMAKLGKDLSRLKQPADN